MVFGNEYTKELCTWLPGLCNAAVQSVIDAALGA